MFLAQISVVELSLLVSVAVLAVALVWLAHKYLRLVAQVENQMQGLKKEVKAIQATSLGMGKKLRQMKKTPTSESNPYIGKAEQQMMTALRRSAMAH